ncbi:Fas apoptotic inhibitory molecule 2 [Cichlidogyrus casuarinus]|uniref:Fas apoptotic inhibitory molecule 2 n=1 Tax=Cichlidogyrus casuarinus TaxID=1844966 RepID=A0ABD2QMH6_9PLAT
MGQAVYPPQTPPPYSTTQPDLENTGQDNNQFAASDFSDKAVRNRFIKKVYTILTVQLLITFGIIAVFHFVSAVFFGVYIALVCCGNIRKKYPLNIILLGVLTLAFSYMAATITAFYQTEAFLIAAGMTCLICLAVTVLAIWGPIDFTKYYFYIAMVGMVFFLFGIVCLIVGLVTHGNGTRILQVVYASIGVLVFSLYLAYNTQQIVGGRKYELSEEEYVTGALELYVDIMNIFLLVLSLTGGRE